MQEIKKITSSETRFTKKEILWKKQKNLISSFLSSLSLYYSLYLYLTSKYTEMQH